ncbi:MAG: hypothetical protein AABX16_01250 [Nanoarchaeota archaeon]
MQDKHLIPQSKQGQHEIAGFVIIVLIVSVIGVIFLSLSFGNQNIEESSSPEISRLLGSSMYVTSSCAINYIPHYRDMQDLVKECHKDTGGNSRNCLNGRNACVVLEEELQTIIEKGLEINEGAVNKAYTLTIYSSSEKSGGGDEILSFAAGTFSNCTRIIGGNHPIAVDSFSGEILDTRLLVCRG